MSLPKPYYADQYSTLYLADCRDILPQFEAAYFDMTAVDPPYGLEVDEWDNAVPYEVLPMLQRVTRGPVTWFASAPVEAMHKDLTAFAALEALPSRTLLWAPKFTLSHTSANGIFFRWHPIYCWNLPKKHLGPKWDILDVSTNTGRRWWKHKGTKPEKLMRQLLGLAVSAPTQTASILDAFAGSGTTLCAAKSLGFHSVGIEYEEESCEIAAKRLSMMAACSLRDELLG